MEFEGIEWKTLGQLGIKYQAVLSATNPDRQERGQPLGWLL